MPQAQSTGFWTGSHRTIIAVFQRSSNVRDLRDTLWELGLVLRQHPGTKGLCVVRETKLTLTRLKLERQRFRDIFAPDLSDRIFLFLQPEGPGDVRRVEPQPLPVPIQLDLTDWQRQCDSPQDVGRDSGRVVKQSVIEVLLAQWMREPRAHTLAEIQQLTGASYPTVASATEEFLRSSVAAAVPRRKIDVRDVPTAVIQEIVEGRVKRRETHRFGRIYPGTYNPAPETLRKRLESLRRRSDAWNNVTVGGVPGAQHYYAQLDITSSPRLDLSVYGAADPVQLARSIDAGLQPANQAIADAEYALVIHIASEPFGFTSVDESSATRYASELECMADLCEMGYRRECWEMAEHLAQKARSRAGGGA